MTYMSILDSYVKFRYDVIMNNMTDKIREMVRESMTQQGMSTYRLAQITEIEQPNVTRLLKGRSGKIPDSWQKVLDALGLELVVQTKRAKGK
jgi:predicted XRE-type DNA-binding protein